MAKDWRLSEGDLERDVAIHASNIYSICRDGRRATHDSYKNGDAVCRSSSLCWRLSINIFLEGVGISAAPMSRVYFFWLRAVLLAMWRLVDDGSEPRISLSVQDVWLNYIWSLHLPLSSS